jgi:hypothetical protein
VGPCSGADALRDGPQEAEVQVELEQVGQRVARRQQGRRCGGGDNIEAALRQGGGRIRGPGGAAELLGLKPTTLASRIKTPGIRKPKA